MKRLYAAILLLIYALSTVGLSAQMHVCGGVLSSVSVNSPTHSDSSCCCSEDEQCAPDDESPASDTDNSDCCTNTEISTKCPDLHHFTAPAAVPSSKVSMAYSLYINSIIEHFQAVSRASFSDYSHAPPDLSSSKSPLFIRYRILLI
ncbi:MAG: hypothetical protein U0264_08100 [Candidatus Kapaibacterium sp.]